MSRNLQLLAIYTACMAFMCAAFFVAYGGFSAPLLLPCAFCAFGMTIMLKNRYMADRKD